MDNNGHPPAKAYPSKAFFIETLTRDISLSECILDLLDNSIHSLITRTDLDVSEHLFAGTKARKIDALVDIALGPSAFSVKDDCGGISIADAEEQVFLLGEPVKERAHTGLGVYGIGMKRAFFKIGRQISIVSHTTDEEFKIDISVDDWRKTDQWDFPFIYARKKKRRRRRGWACHGSDRTRGRRRQPGGGSLSPFPYGVGCGHLAHRGRAARFSITRPSKVNNSGKRQARCPVRPMVRRCAHAALLVACVVMAPRASRAVHSDLEGRLRQLVEEVRVRGNVPAMSVAVAVQGLRDLLTHTAGLPVSYAGIGTSPEPRPLALQDYLVSRLRTTRVPREKIVYANDGYALLGYIAAKADAQSFEDHVQTVLFDPLGMASSTLRSPSEVGSRLAIPYGATFGAFGLKNRGTHSDASAVAPAATLITTASDLARFARLYLEKGAIDGVRILRPDTVAEMTRLQARQHAALDEGYGLGFMVRERAGRRLIWHDGGLAGMSARLAIAPDYRVAVVVLSNSSDANAVSGLVSRIIDLLAGPGDPLELAAPSVLRGISGAYRLVDVLPPGHWLRNAFFNLELDISEAGATLTSFPILSPLPIEPLGPDRFRVRGWYLDGAIAKVERDRLYVGILEARRLAPWETARALMAYAAALGLSVLGAAAVGVRSVVRRLRRHRAASSL